MSLEALSSESWWWLLLFLLISSHVPDPWGIEKGLERRKDLRGGPVYCPWEGERGSTDGIPPVSDPAYDRRHVHPCKQKNAARTLISDVPRFIREPFNREVQAFVRDHALCLSFPSANGWSCKLKESRKQVERYWIFRYWWERCSRSVCIEFL